MKLSRKAGATSEIWQVFIRDSSSTTGGGLTGLTNATSGLTAYYHRDTDTTATAISLVTMTVGTFTSSGFKEIDATNMPGHYQFCPPNAALASGAKSCMFHLKGATNMAPLPIEADLDSQVDVSKWNGTAVPAENTAGYPLVDTAKVSGTAQTARDLGASVLLSTGTGTGQLDFTSGVVKANATQWLGGTIPAVNVTGVPLVDAKYLLGTIFSTPATAGILDANLKNIANAAVSTSTAQLGVNVVNVAGSASTGTAGYVGVDWGQVTNKTTTNALTGTTIATSQVVASVTGAVGSVTGAVGSVTGNVGGNVVGSVASVTAAVTLSAGDSPVLQSGTASAGGASTITIASAIGADSRPVGCTIKITGGTGSGQARVVTAYVNSTQVVTVDRAWTTQPDATSVYSILYTEAAALSAGLKVTGLVLADTVTTYTGNTLQTGDSYARLGAPAGASIAADLAEIEAETDGIAAIPTNPYTGTPPTVAAIATAVWTDTTAGDFTVALSVGKSILNGVSLGTGLTIARCTLTDTLTTYTGDTPQTGDSFARLGVAGAGLTALGDTRVANLDATISSRTKPADTQAAVTLVTTTTNLTNLPSIPTNWLTAAGITASALNGKGDWSTYAGGDTSGTTTLLTRIPGTVQPQTGDAYARVGAAGAGLTALGDARIAHLDADVSSRLATSGYTVPPTSVVVAAAVWDLATSGHTTASTFGAAVTAGGNVTVAGYASGQDPATLVLDATAASHNTAGTIGNKINAAGAAGDPLISAVPGGYAQGSAGWSLGRIGTGQIITSSVVSPGGGVEITQGVDYSSADGYAIDWTDTSNVWPVLTDATIAVTIYTGTTTFAGTGSVVTATGSSKKVRWEPTAAQTAALAQGNWKLKVTATLSNGHVVQLVRATALVSLV